MSDMACTYLGRRARDAALLVQALRRLVRAEKCFLHLTRYGLVRPESLLAQRCVELLEVGQEPLRDTLLAVDLNRALEDLIGERVAASEVLGGDSRDISIRVEININCNALPALGLSL
jgi:hypothetical protein